MSACRYEKGPCTYPTALRRYFRCQDGSCPEQAGRVCSRTDGEKSTLVHVAHSPEPQAARHRETPANETKPAAPVVAREEDETMKDTKEAPAREAGELCGRCQRPNRGNLEAAHGHDGRYCGSCATMIRKCDRQKRPCPPFTGATLKGGAGKVEAGPARPAKTTKATKATTGKPAPPIAQQKPASAASAPVKPQPDPAPFVGEGASLVFAVRIAPGTTALELMDLLRSVPSNAQIVG